MTIRPLTTRTRCAATAAFFARTVFAMRERLHNALRVESAPRQLVAALKHGEFVLYYQPEVDLLTGRVTGAEALIRWQHPQRGLLGPAQFLPQIDGTPLEEPLGAWVIESVLQRLEQWSSAGLDLAVGINLGANVLLHPDFPHRLQAALERHRTVPRANLILEILETTALSDMQRAAETVLRCRDMGVRFALDDFGTGYSSLSCFRLLAVDILKIDQSFIRDMLDDPSDLDIVESVVRLAHSMNRTVIAEGVETLEHGAVLLSLGCPICQGYGISRPMPPERLPDWMEKWRAQAMWLDVNQLVETYQDLALLVASKSHRGWVGRLIAYLDDPRQCPAPEIDPTRCRFGRWLRAGGTLRYGAHTQFQQIGPIHERMHALGAEILELGRGGNVHGARARLPELLATRDELDDRLDELVQFMPPGLPAVAFDGASTPGDPC